ncbi:hypothetical protein QM012_002110 [Aureobasidium pullulans]|uniref:WD40 repeat-like protein n=1 Tax=Aureobasidium pullulans TaxID=5580 RepID=A0ABR0TDT2_AURPU
MQEDMMLTLMALNHVPILPSPTPALINIDLPDDMKSNDDNTIIDATTDVSQTTTPPVPNLAESSSVEMQMNTQTIEHITVTTSSVSTMASAEIQSADEVKVGKCTEKITTKAKTNSEDAQNISSASPPTPEETECSYKMSTLAQDANKEVRPIEDTDSDMVAGALITPPSAEPSTETGREGLKPAAIASEVVKATKTAFNIENTEDSEPKLSNIEAHEPMDLDVVDKSAGKTINTSPGDHNPATPAAESTHTRGGLDHEQIVSRNTSSAGAPLSTPDSTPDAMQPDDTTTKVSGLHATYDSSRNAERADGNTEGDSVPDVQAENASLNNAKVTASESTMDSIPRAQTFEPIAEQEVEAPLPLKPRESLFSGPAGRQITPTVQVTHAPRAGLVAQTETPKGFEELFQEEMTGVSPKLNSFLQQSESLDIGEDFKFGVSNTEEATQSVVKNGIEPEAVTGAEQERSSPLSKPDHDAKPDMNTYPRPTSPAHSGTSSHDSQVTHKTSASKYQDVVDHVLSGECYLEDPHNQPTPEELAKQKPISTDQPILQSQPCDCESEYRCSHRRIGKHNLRPRPDLVYSNHIPDTDTSGDYTDEIKVYPTPREVTRADRDEDEETIEDEEEDCLMSGGLVLRDDDPMSRFRTTIPFNETDALIRDKNPFDEESTEEDEPVFKRNNKRKKKAKVARQDIRQAKKPKITDDTDALKMYPPHSLSRVARASRSIRTTALKITEMTEKSPVRKPLPLPRTSKAVKETTSTKQKNTTANPPLQSIIEMMQRAAKPSTTKLSYPITFNAKSSCSICRCPSYAIIGTGFSRNIKIYDFGTGNREVPDANQADMLMGLVHK